MKPTGLTQKKAARILARAWNYMDASIIEPHIADDIIC